ncbi:hypothetical protein C4585_01635 [Candidatus Parcubacteria bacterium]|nr:MAG: hypothetical protein C4585_01635 [Candidatus Parcubacteria bacterium]
MMFFRRRRRRVREIAPDEIFLDASNLPSHNEGQFEGRVVRPVAPRALLGIGVVCILLMSVFLVKIFHLEIMQGTVYADISRNNRLDRSVMFASRGIIHDRTGREIAWNESFSSSTSPTSSPMFATRHYIDLPGLAHILGFVRYPKADARGAWWREEYTGVSGVELAFDHLLAGSNGSRMVETDARGEVQQQDIVITPKNGNDLTLTIDAEVQSKLYTVLSEHAERQGFDGGAAVIMDVETGELLALTSFPEYDNTAFTEGDKEAIRDASSSSLFPLLNRAVAGLYAPGSIVKPIFAAGALAEDIISPEREIVSIGAMTIPNPYNPDLPTIFRDWAVHGSVDMRTAIAVSSDEYFYVLGGGLSAGMPQTGDRAQEGLGIERLDEYAKLFGLSTKTGIELLGEEEGLIPTPEWKEAVFGPDDPWRLGNTYHTAIGQFGFQVTPIQAVRFTAAIANGRLTKPQLIKDARPEYTTLPISEEDLNVVRDGMQLAVTSTRSDATVKALNIPGIKISAKTGTAEVGSRNQWMNSWSVGYWPGDNPRYAYAVVLEKAPAGTLSGAAPGLRPFFEWLIAHKPEYVD